MRSVVQRDGRDSSQGSSPHAQVLADLEARKREATQELHLLSQNLEAESLASTTSTGDVHDLIPADTDVAASIAPNADAGRLELTLRTSNATVVKGAVLFAEQVSCQTPPACACGSVHLAASCACCLQLGLAQAQMSTWRDFQLCCSLVLDAQVFEGESLFVHADAPRGTLVVPLAPQKNDPIDMLVKARCFCRAM
jgi:Ciliary BBSome complex subunit 2, C-terminal